MFLPTPGLHAVTCNTPHAPQDYAYLVSDPKNDDDSDMFAAVDGSSEASEGLLASDCVRPEWGVPGAQDIEVHAELTRQGFNPLSMPGTIWTATMLVYLTEGFSHIFLAILLQLAATVGLQGYAAYQIAVIMSDHNSEHGELCVVRDDWLPKVCSLVFIMLVLQELKETFDMGRWLSRFPRAAAWAPLRLREFVSERAAGSLRGRVCALKPVSGVTEWGRLGIAAATLVPKSCIGLSILYYGTAYVMSAPDKESLLQNSVALVFILEIDNAVYELFIPNHLKQLVTKLQEFPISLSSEEFEDSYAWKYNSFGLIGLPATLVLILVYLDWKWCYDEGPDSVAEALPSVYAIMFVLAVSLCSLSLRCWGRG